MAYLRRCAAILSLCVSASAIMGPAGNGTNTVHKTDTYLDAYSKSRIEAEKAKQGVIIITAKDAYSKSRIDAEKPKQGVTIITANDGEKKISSRDDSYSGYDYSPPYSSDSSSFSASGSSGFSGPSVSNNYLPPSNYGSPVKFEPEITYNSPTNSYGPPAHNYGPPAPTYGPPAQIYGPPAPSYGPPHKPPVPIYGPPPKPFYGVPYTAPGLGFLDRLSLKLDILTIAKLLLKLLIFKKIVTMIAVVCMLLVIPKLITFKKDGSGAGHNDETDDRKFGSNKVVELTSVQQLFERAMSVYGRQQTACGFTCRVLTVIDDLYEFQPYYREDAVITFGTSS